METERRRRHESAMRSRMHEKMSSASFRYESPDYESDGFDENINFRRRKHAMKTADFFPEGSSAPPMSPSADTLLAYPSQSVSQFARSQDELVRLHRHSMESNQRMFALFDRAQGQYDKRPQRQSSQLVGQSQQSQLSQLDADAAHTYLVEQFMYAHQQSSAQLLHALER